MPTDAITNTPRFKQWFEDVKAEATRRDVAWLITEPADHQDGFVDGYTPTEEVDEQIGAAQSLA